MAPSRQRGAPQRRRGSGLLSLLLVLAVMGGTGFAAYKLILEEKEVGPPAVPGDAGAGSPRAADAAGPIAGDASTVLPELEFAQPALRSATWTDVSTNLVLGAGAPVAQRRILGYAADFTQRATQFDLTLDDGPAATMVSTAGYAFTPGEAFGTPWTRHPQTARAGERPIYDASTLDLYGDRVSDEVRRAARAVSIAQNDVDRAASTTYGFDIDVRVLFPGIDGELARPARAELFVTHVELTIDEAGLIRREAFVLDRAAWEAELVAAGGGLIVVDLVREITSLDSPVDVVVPTNWVDAPPSP